MESGVSVFAISFAICSSLVLFFYLPFIRVGLNEGDEGYLHFGSVNLLNGLVPIRDFRAYDPGRYFWCALWMRFLGPTFFTQRLAMGFIMIVSLTIMCSLAFIASDSWVIAILSSLISFVWTRPYYKAFEICFCLIVVAVVACFIYSPDSTSFLISGFVIGFGLFFGLNFSLYAGLSIMLALVLVAVTRQDALSFVLPVWMLAGFTLGLIPILILGLTSPGYFSMYWEKKVLAVVNRGTSNLPLPLPWLWSAPPQLSVFSVARRFFFKAVFTFMIPFYAVSLIVTVFSTDVPLTEVTAMQQAIIFSTCIVGFVYLHHLFSRADVSHMLQTTHPAILLVSTLVATYLSWPWAILILLVFCVLSAWAILPRFSPKVNYFRNPENYSGFDTGREEIKLGKHQAQVFKKLKQLIDANSHESDHLFFAPIMPGFYEIFSRRPSQYDVFCIYAASNDFQRRMIQEIDDQKTRLAIIYELQIDGKEDLRFSVTHANVWKHLQNNFTLLDSDGLPGHIKIFRTKV